MRQDFAGLTARVVDDHLLRRVDDQIVLDAGDREILTGVSRYRPLRRRGGVSTTISGVSRIVEWRFVATPPCSPDRARECPLPMTTVMPSGRTMQGSPARLTASLRATATASLVRLCLAVRRDRSLVATAAPARSIGPRGWWSWAGASRHHHSELGCGERRGSSGANRGGVMASAVSTCGGTPSSEQGRDRGGVELVGALRRREQRERVIPYLVSVGRRAWRIAGR